MTQVHYKIIDPSKQFNSVKCVTKIKYKTQNDKLFNKAQDRIDLFQYYCSKCDTDFSSKSTKERHICKPLEGDALNYAVGVANDHINNGGILVTSVSDIQNDLETFTIEDLIPENFESVKLEIFEPNWAARPKHGKMYGKKYIEVYKEFLKHLFELEN